MAKAHGSFELASWAEDTYQDLGGGAKLTRASVTQTFTGAVEGDGSVEWLMAYRTDGTAHFVGLQHLRGRIGDRHGTFVLETTGDFDGTQAVWEGSVVPGTATDDLEGLSARATFGAPHGSKADFELDYSFE